MSDALPMTVKEVAEHFRASELTVRRWISAGRLAAYRSPGGRILVAPETVAAFESTPAHVTPSTEGPAA